MGGRGFFRPPFTAAGPRGKKKKKPGGGPRCSKALAKRGEKYGARGAFRPSGRGGPPISQRDETSPPILRGLERGGNAARRSPSQKRRTEVCEGGADTLSPGRSPRPTGFRTRGVPTGAATDPGPNSRGAGGVKGLFLNDRGKSGRVPGVGETWVSGRGNLQESRRAFSTGGRRGEEGQKSVSPLGRRRGGMWGLVGETPGPPQNPWPGGGKNRSGKSRGGSGLKGPVLHAPCFLEAGFSLKVSGGGRGGWAPKLRRTLRGGPVFRFSRGFVLVCSFFRCWFLFCHRGGGSWGLVSGGGFS